MTRPIDDAMCACDASALHAPSSDDWLSIDQQQSPVAHDSSCVLRMCSRMMIVLGARTCMARIVMTQRSLWKADTCGARVPSAAADTAADTAAAAAEPPSPLPPPLPSSPPLLLLVLVEAGMAVELAAAFLVAFVCVCVPCARASVRLCVQCA